MHIILIIVLIILGIEGRITKEVIERKVQIGKLDEKIKDLEDKLENGRELFSEKQKSNGGIKKDKSSLKLD